MQTLHHKNKELARLHRMLSESQGTKVSDEEADAAFEEISELNEKVEKATVI